MVTILLVAVAFVAMEPVTYAAHRWVMHGVGVGLHRSHHRARQGRLEANDWYPVIFAGVVMGAFAVGLNVAGGAWLVPVCVGITLYGLAYGLVHDGYIHGRIPVVRRRRVAALHRLADAHRIHHLYGGEPYGMLLPVVPARLRRRAASTVRNPLRQATR